MRLRPLILSAALALAPSIGRAQYYNYPSFQLPRITAREYNFLAADGGDAGTSLVFQWREGVASRTHMTLDVGLADPDSPSANARLIIGGGLAFGVNSASSELPLDLAFTTGVGGSFGEGRSFLRIPFGLSVGHRFAFDTPLAVFPYAHPRLSIDYCGECRPNGRSDTSIGVDIDLGVSLELTRNIAIRASAVFAGSDFNGRDNGFGVSLAWTPSGLR